MTDLDPAALFDQALASSSTRVATASSPSSFAVLRLQPKPRLVKVPTERREIALVDAGLKNVFRSLVSGKSRWPLFLHGRPGTGKTCAALALLDHLFPWQQVYFTAAELTSAVMATFGTKEPFDWTRFGRYRADVGSRDDSPDGKRGAALVVIDELGIRSNVSDTHYECVQRVLDLRVGLPLIVVSNHDIAGIGRIYDARIASRCESGTVVELAGRDRRTM